jgi:iron(III) transport system permease protein
MAVICASLLRDYSPAWQHLADTVLLDYLSTSFLLMLGVGVGTFLLGVSAAWMSAMCEFPGRRWLSWALLLPMAMPAYIIAYTYTGILDFAGPLQSALREATGWGYGDYYFPEIRSTGGAIAMLSLVLYPYVYLITRVAFAEQSTAVLEASRSLGRGPWRTFFTVALPLARPAIVAGISLALMETLADYGTVEYFGVSAFTTGIFRTWYGLGELTTAAQLAACLMLFVFGLIILERYSRARMRYHDRGVQTAPRRILLPPLAGGLCSLFCLTVIACGFIVPVVQLLWWAVQSWQPETLSQLTDLIYNSFTLALVAALLALFVALLLAYGQRLHPGRLERLAVRTAAIGYAVPGTVIAVGVLIPFGWLDNRIDALSSDWFGRGTGLLLSGSLAAVTFAYVVRFLSVSVQTLESGLSRIKPSIDESARVLGRTPAQVLRDIHLPMLRGSLLTALLLVFVDVLKELPTTLILRPFNFNTLAVRAYELASDERLSDAATPALTIVLISLIPVILLSVSIGRSKR